MIIYDQSCDFCVSFQHSTYDLVIKLIYLILLYLDIEHRIIFFKLQNEIHSYYKNNARKTLWNCFKNIKIHTVLYLNKFIVNDNIDNFRLEKRKIDCHVHRLFWSKFFITL